MQCKKCGVCHDRVILEFVEPPNVNEAPCSIPQAVKPVLYKRWACRACGQYHFEDGTLYANPYAKQ